MKTAGSSPLSGQRGLYILCFLIFLISFTRVGNAESFPFRAVHPGDDLPDITLTSQEDGTSLSLSSLAGRPLVLAFWGGDLTAKKKRSLKVLRAIAGNRERLDRDRIQLLVINVQNDADAILEEIRANSGLTVPFYRDEGQKAYDALGIYVLPSVLFVSETGKISGGIGYSKDFNQRFTGEAEIMLGRKTRAQLDRELNPTMKKVPEKIKTASRHLRMGRNMESKGMTESALREFAKAVELNPELAEGYIEMGCLLVQAGKLDEAAKVLEIGQEKNPDSVRAAICLARIDAHDGDVDGALADLQSLLFRHARDAELHFMIGTLQEKKGAVHEAAVEYRKAYELLREKQLLKD